MYNSLRMAQVARSIRERLNLVTNPVWYIHVTTPFVQKHKSNLIHFIILFTCNHKSYQNVDWDTFHCTALKINSLHELHSEKSSLKWALAVNFNLLHTPGKNSACKPFLVSLFILLKWLVEIIAKHCLNSQ